MRMTLSGTVIPSMGFLLADFRYPPAPPYHIRQVEYLNMQEEKGRLSSACEKLKKKVESTEQTLQVELNLQLLTELELVPCFHFGSNR